MPGGGDLCVTGAVLDGETVGLRAADGVIAELGPGVEPEAGEDRLEAGGALLRAPLLNGHTHAAMTLFRGRGDDLPLMRWLKEAIWPVEARLEPADVYWGTRLACLEMIRTGTTAFWDMYWQPEESSRAVIDAGLRATIGPPLIDGGSAAEAESMRSALVESLDMLSGLDPRVGSSLSPHAIYTVGTESLEWVAATASERGVPIQIHLSETEAEVNDCLAEHGLRPAAYLDRIGLLGPGTSLAHGVWLDRGELELIAERGATVITNPVANMKLAVGAAFPYRQAIEAGVEIGLGTDGAGSNNSLDLFSDLKALALIQRHCSGDAAVIPVGQAWRIATGAASSLLGGAATLEVGAPADFLLLDPDSPELSLGELTSALVYAAGGGVVSSTVVAGRVLMEDRKVPGSEEVIARARERARALGLESGPR